MIYFSSQKKKKNRGGATIIYRRPQQKNTYPLNSVISTQKQVLDANSKLCFIIYRKLTDWKNYLYFK